MKTTYTIETLNAQLAHARQMMIDAGVPGLRLMRTCADDTTLARQIEASDPFNVINPEPKQIGCMGCLIGTCLCSVC